MTVLYDVRLVAVPFKHQHFLLPTDAWDQTVRVLSIHHGRPPGAVVDGAYCPWPQRGLTAADLRAMRDALDEARARQRLPF